MGSQTGTRRDAGKPKMRLRHIIRHVIDKTAEFILELCMPVLPDLVLHLSDTNMLT